MKTRERLFYYSTSGSLAASLLFVAQLGAISQLDFWLLYSAFCFAFSIPLLTFALFHKLLLLDDPEAPIPTKLVIYSAAIGQIDVVLGLFSFLSHLSIFLGIVFMALSLVEWWIFTVWSRRQVGRLDGIDGKNEVSPEGSQAKEAASNGPRSGDE